MSNPSSPASFATPSEATAWMLACLKEEGEEYVDNERFAYLDDEKAMAQYHAQAATGCCGFFDREVCIAGRLATVGCNHGH